MPTQPLKRAYTGKDVDMLTACGTIIDQAIIHKATLVAKRANWADPFLPDIKTRISNAFSDVLGIDTDDKTAQGTHSTLPQAGVQFSVGK